MILPDAYLKRMKELLGNEYNDFIQSYYSERCYGLRVNTSKVAVEDFARIFPHELQRVPWCPTGFYYEKGIKPGKHPYHAAGLYYVQEPSAMAVVEALSPQPGEVVLDISAAPGGKATHIANKIGEKGLLVANEINPLRARALVENIERLGIKNAVVLNNSPDSLLHSFKNFFDKIVVDAPCSGEGMFRKDPEVCYSWSEGMVRSCSRTQIRILEVAADLLKPGGLMSYSTCTFSPEENEQVISQFLKRRPDFELIDVPVSRLFSRGRPDWGDGNPQLAKCMRLWPHRIRGEGHFIAILKKLESDDIRYTGNKSNSRMLKTGDARLQFFYDFCRETMAKPFDDGRIVTIGDDVYQVPDLLPDLRNLKVLRYGWHLGQLKKGRFEPSHAMALSLRFNDVLRYVDLESDGEAVMNYLRGQPIELSGDMAREKGWLLVCVDGFALGWGKVAGGIFKNHYPKGLRIDW
ncbi:RsmF rRNA methyltransferase first C-terminal domain-containing protein [Caldanaerobius polysaccharolyticus]|uniref:RsmF rRNA methyltransferase first C-terminal domain-containing protein n=1 Tax=Caldanaerobius polysaccharolyticus TaxID=44256 RepID=UPI0004788D88|nr:RsmB/NOP family class I SAM-dependent RNA methyltransferase [Caldanaerobius polysaccharolyticus]